MRLAMILVAHLFLSPATGITSEPIEPIVIPTDLNPTKVSLGRRLFNDPILSANNSISCASCHDFKRGGADGKSLAIGIHGRKNELNTPSVFNSALNFKQFWDGRAESLEEQLDGPLHGENEMASTWVQIIQKLQQDLAYLAEFKKVYSSQPNENNIRNAIVTFERSLATPDSKFDRFLRGETHALDGQEREGYRRFKDYGCIACHQGRNIGGNMFQVFGVMGNIFSDRKKLTRGDLGRFNVTQKESDKHRFKVPSLRNVALTAPYFHDGSASTIEDAVKIMGKYQLGRDLSAKDIELISRFLRSLTGKTPEGNAR